MINHLKYAFQIFTIKKENEALKKRVDSLEIVLDIEKKNAAEFEEWYLKKSDELREAEHLLEDIFKIIEL